MSKKENKLTKTDEPRKISNSLTNDKLEVFGKAKKYRYPLHHNRKSIVLFSLIILIVTAILLVVAVTTNVYRFAGTSTTTYEITKRLPLPLGAVNGDSVSYSEYLFEYRSATKQLEQQEYELNEKEKEALKSKALSRVFQNEIARQLAKEYEISVSDKEVALQVQQLQAQISDDDDTTNFDSVLASNYGWTQSDLEHAIYLQILKSKLPRYIDTQALKQAADIQKALAKEPENFGALAAKFSADEASAENDGDAGFIEKDSTSYPVEFTEALYNLKKGQISETVYTNFELYIIKFNEEKDGVRGASYIRIPFMASDDLLKKLEADAEIKIYVGKLRVEKDS